MGPNRYRYCKGGNGKQESVELDVYNKGEYHTTCVINVCFLLIGCKWFPCSNGYEHAITSEETIKILELIQKERKKLTDSETVKTMDGWSRSGLSEFGDYCFPGDEVSQDIVDYFVNSVPPVLMRSNCTQAGEEYSVEKDENGEYRNTYTTFHKEPGGNWIFDGYCFFGSNENRGSRPSKLEMRILQAKRRSN